LLPLKKGENKLLWDESDSLLNFLLGLRKFKVKVENDKDKSKVTIFNIRSLFSQREPTVHSFYFPLSINAPFLWVFKATTSYTEQKEVETMM